MYGCLSFYLNQHFSRTGIIFTALKVKSVYGYTTLNTSDLIKVKFVYGYITLNTSDLIKVKLEYNDQLY